jgi:hypothetical protein
VAKLAAKFQLGMDNLFQLCFHFQLRHHQSKREVAAQRIEFLRDSFRSLSGMSDLDFRKKEEELLTECEFRVPANKLRIVFGIIFETFVRKGYSYSQTHFSQMSLNVQVPPNSRISADIDNAESIAFILTLAEVLIPAENIYAEKAESYVQSYGELPPAAKSNLDLLSNQLGLPRNRANELNAEAIVEPFTTLEEKYEHFRKRLLACTRESHLSGDYWENLKRQAEKVRFPKEDLDFLQQERREQLLTLGNSS